MRLWKKLLQVLVGARRCRAHAPAWHAGDLGPLVDVSCVGCKMDWHQVTRLVVASRGIGEFALWPGAEQPDVALQIYSGLRFNQAAYPK